jgi:hypothetical protein
MGEGSTSLSCGVVCHQAWNDVWVVSPVAERRAPLAWPESPASGSPQSAPAEACRPGPAGVESAVSRSPYRSALGRHSLEANFFSHAYTPPQKTGGIPLPMHCALARYHDVVDPCAQGSPWGLMTRRSQRSPGWLARVGGLMAPLHGLCPRHSVVRTREGSCSTSLHTQPV